MLATISPLDTLRRAKALAEKADAGALFLTLRDLSLADPRYLHFRFLLAFIADHEIFGIASSWSHEDPNAAELGRLGEILWANTELFDRLRPAGTDQLVTSVLRGSLESHYLAAMAASRRALPDDGTAAWLQRLRLLILLRSIEAANAGIRREAHLLGACTQVRQICETTNSPKRAWLAEIVHEEEPFRGFVDETRYRCRQALSEPRADAAKRNFLNDLLALLDRDWRELPVEGAPLGGEIRVALKPVRVPAPDPFPLPLDDVPAEHAAIHAVTGEDEATSFTPVKADDALSTPAQRRQATGVVLQTLEETQYLRHSWHRLASNEEAALLSRIRELLSTGETAADKVGAALIYIAVLTSSSATSVVHLPIGADPGEDWTLDLRTGRLQRKPPRFAGRWRATPEGGSSALPWVQRLSKAWSFQLAEPMLAPLRGHGKRHTTLAGIWQAAAPGRSLDSWFAADFGKDQLARLTSPVLSTVMAQHVFESTHDHVLARLASSNTRTGLPAACAYSAYRAPELHQALHQVLASDLAQIVAPAEEDDTNAAGSELDLDIRRLRREIERVQRAVTAAAADPGRWVEHHNLLCSLCVLALLASTGARPVTSPFESRRWFDLEHKRVYVEDKRSGPTQGARLCVLADRARDLLVECYLPHLQRLRDAMAQAAPDAAVELNKLVSGADDCRLPLFFFLREQRTFDWSEVTESQLGWRCGIDWPLPWNLFRHLQATQLRRWGLDPEIRDALLAHGDRGAESHGDFSWRTPADDLETARPLVNRLVEELGFALPRAGSGPALSGHKFPSVKFSASRIFGRLARAEQRQRTHEAARASARADIRRELNDRPPDSLSADDWDAIARVMLIRDSGLPHSMASIRYEELEAFMAAQWHEQGVRPKLRRRYVPIAEGSSPFTEDSIGTEARLDVLRSEFDELAAKLQARRPLPVLAGCLAAIDLVLFSGAANFQALCALVCNQPSIRVVRFEDSFWFEWSYRGPWQDGRPVYRVPATARAAAWAVESRSNAKQLQSMPATPSALSDFGRAGTHDTSKQPRENFGQTLKRLCQLAAQTNALTLPGAVASFLNGRRQAPALPHADWVRAVRQAAPVLALASRENIDDAYEPAAFFAQHHRAVRRTAAGSELEKCRVLFGAVQDALKPSDMSNSARAVVVGRAAMASGFAVGDAPFVLAHYVWHLLTRKKQAGQGTLRASTVLRYWYSLSTGFLDAAAHANLSVIDDEEITELYAAIVDMAASSASGRSSVDASDARSRTLDQLHEFHEFARKTYGTEDPDWSEISPAEVAGIGRPGMVLREEYECALAVLLEGSKLDALDDERLAGAFVLIACARFGLRLGEAVGLHRSDWLDTAEAVVVLVRSNATRGLKTHRSKRQVPLVEPLNPMERAVIDEVMNRWLHRHGKNSNNPLLSDPGADTFEARKGSIGAMLLPLIKSVTLNDVSTIHHLRHSYANRVVALLTGHPAYRRLGGTDEQSLHARKLLLARSLADRRTLWAVARLLGHASPATTITSYLHCFDWLVPKPAHRAGPAYLLDPPAVIDLDKLPRDDAYVRREIPLVEDDSPSEPLLLRLMRYLRLRTVPISMEKAVRSARLSHVQAIGCDRAVDAAAMRWVESQGDPSERTSSLTQNIPLERWNALVDLVAAARSSTPGQHEILPKPQEWLPTVGRRRQIVLFEKEHFGWMRAFLQELDLGPDDCDLVYTEGLNEKVMRYLEDADLQDYRMTRRQRGGHFELDIAIFGELNHVAPDRVVVVPSGNAAATIKTTYELLTLWVVWICALYVSDPDAALAAHEPMNAALRPQAERPTRRRLPNH